jgi:TIR domain
VDYDFCDAEILERAMADIFVSYKREDQIEIRRLVEALQGQGWSVWWDTKIDPDVNWDREIEKQLQAAKCILVAWSKLAVESDPVRTEAHYGRERQKLVSITLDGTNPPIMFALRQTTDLSNWNAATSNPRFEGICQAIRRLVHTSTGSVAEPRIALQPKLVDQQEISEMPMLMLHAAWMRDYSGLESGDQLLGQHSWLKEREDGDDEGHEIYNFLPIDGKCYGYAPVPKRVINLANLGGDATDNVVTDVLVVWTARRPERGRMIVGWYVGAEVHRELTDRPPSSGRKNMLTYIVEAPASGCRLLAPEERFFIIPTQQQGFPGTSASFYAENNLAEEWNEAIRRYISFMNRVG